MEVPVTLEPVKKATFVASGDRISTQDLIKVVDMIGNAAVIQIVIIGNEMKLNLKQNYDLGQLDSLKDRQIRSKMKITGVKYVGKQREILITIVGLDSDTCDEAVLNYVDQFIETSSRKVMKHFHREKELMGIYNGKRTILARKIRNMDLVGSYHQIEDQCVRIFFNGVKSCGYCFLSESTCAKNANFDECKWAHKSIRPNKEKQIMEMNKKLSNANNCNPKDTNRIVDPEIQRETASGEENLSSETHISPNKDKRAVEKEDESQIAPGIQCQEASCEKEEPDIFQTHIKNASNAGMLSNNTTPEKSKVTEQRVILEPMTSPLWENEEDLSDINPEGTLTYAQAASPEAATRKRKALFCTGGTPPQKNIQIA